MAVARWRCRRSRTSGRSSALRGPSRPSAASPRHPCTAAYGAVRQPLRGRWGGFPLQGHNRLTALRRAPGAHLAHPVTVSHEHLAGVELVRAPLAPAVRNRHAAPPQGSPAAAARTTRDPRCSRRRAPGAPAPRPRNRTTRTAPTCTAVYGGCRTSPGPGPAKAETTRSRTRAPA